MGCTPTVWRLKGEADARWWCCTVLSCSAFVVAQAFQSFTTTHSFHWVVVLISIRAFLLQTNFQIRRPAANFHLPSYCFSLNLSLQVLCRWWRSFLGETISGECARTGAAVWPRSVTARAPRRALRTRRATAWQSMKTVQKGSLLVCLGLLRSSRICNGVARAKAKGRLPKNTTTATERLERGVGRQTQNIRQGTWDAWTTRSTSPAGEVHQQRGSGLREAKANARVRSRHREDCRGLHQTIGSNPSIDRERSPE